MTAFNADYNTERECFEQWAATTTGQRKTPELARMTDFSAGAVLIATSQ
jgi:hypothetical protein